MPRASVVAQLDPRIREEVDRAVREGRATIDQIVEMIGQLGGEASRSAVGRYVRNAREQMERYRQAQEVARVWVGRLEQEPDGDVGRLLSEMLRTVAFQALGEMGGAVEGPKAGEVMMLARAIKDLSSADKTRADMVLKVRKEIAARLEKEAREVEKLAKKGGLSDETVREIRARIMGVAS